MKSFFLSISVAIKETLLIFSDALRNAFKVVLESKRPCDKYYEPEITFAASALRLENISSINLYVTEFWTTDLWYPS